MADLLWTAQLSLSLATHREEAPICLVKLSSTEASAPHWDLVCSPRRVACHQYCLPETWFVNSSEDHRRTGRGTSAGSRESLDSIPQGTCKAGVGTARSRTSEPQAWRHASLPSARADSVQRMLSLGPHSHPSLFMAWRRFPKEAAPSKIGYTCVLDPL